MKKFFLFIVCLLVLTSCAKDEVSTFGGIYGTIRSAETGSVVYNAEITLSPGHPSPITGTNGAYEFSNLEARQYTMTVRASGYLDDSRQVTVLPGENTQCDVLLTPERDIEGVSISTRTLDFGSTLSHLSVTLYNTGNTPVSWTVSTKSSVGWMTVSPMSGTTDAGKSSVISVSVDRSRMTDDSSAIFIINAAGGSKSVTVYASKNGSTGGGNTGGNTGGGTEIDPNVTNGLYAYYMFNGDFQNSVDGAPHGQGINAPTFTDGVNGSKAVKLSVLNDSYINIPEAMIDKNTFSISFWIKGLSDGHLFHVSSTYDNYGTHIFTMKDGRLTFWSWWRTSYEYTFAHPAISSTQWNMITLTCAQRDGNSSTNKRVTVKLYINGEFVDVVDCGVNGINCGTKFVFGGRLDNITPPSMTIDNLRVYNSRTLSDEEVKLIYNSEK